MGDDRPPQPPTLDYASPAERPRGNADTVIVSVALRMGLGLVCAMILMWFVRSDGIDRGAPIIAGVCAFLLGASISVRRLLRSSRPPTRT